MTWHVLLGDSLPFPEHSIPLHKIRKTPSPLRYNVLPDTTRKARSRTGTNRGRINSGRNTKCAQTSAAADVRWAALGNEQTRRGTCKKVPLLPFCFIPRFKRCSTKLQACRKHFLVQQPLLPELCIAGSNSVTSTLPDIKYTPSSAPACFTHCLMSSDALAK